MDPRLKVRYIHAKTASYWLPKNTLTVDAWSRSYCRELAINTSTKLGSIAVSYAKEDEWLSCLCSTNDCTRTILYTSSCLRCHGNVMNCMMLSPAG